MVAEDEREADVETLYEMEAEMLGEIEVDIEIDLDTLIELATELDAENETDIVELNETEGEQLVDGRTGIDPEN